MTGPGADPRHGLGHGAEGLHAWVNSGHEVDRAVLEGMTQASGVVVMGRRLRDHLGEVYGVEASAQLISNVTDVIVDEITAWQNRPVDDVYPIMYVDATVRHEALCYRVEVEDRHRLVVAAAGLKLEAA